MSTNPINGISAAGDFGYQPQTGADPAEILGGLANAAMSIAGGMGGVTGLGGLGGASNALMYAKLMQEQNRIQQENLVFSAQSNASKSQHDTRKTIINNWRAG